MHQLKEFGISAEGDNRPRLIRPSIVTTTAGVLLTVTTIQFATIGLPALLTIL